MRVDELKFSDTERQKMWDKLTDLSKDYIKLDIRYKQLEGEFRNLNENIRKVIRKRIAPSDKIKQISELLVKCYEKQR